MAARGTGAPGARRTRRGGGVIEHAVIATPLGHLALGAAEGRIARAGWSGAALRPPAGGVLAEAARQVGAYFGGEGGFALDLAPEPDPLRAALRAALLAIPRGRTRSYGEIARELGATAKEIGRACAANPLPLIVPCHRVLAAEGLGGYSGGDGIETKIALLKLEGAYPMLL